MSSIPRVETDKVPAATTMVVVVIVAALVAFSMVR